MSLQVGVMITIVTVVRMISKQSVAVAVCLVQELVISQWQPTCIS